jgi:hypothetical protein
MNYLEIIGLILATPLVIIVIAANIVKSEARRIEKLKAEAARRRWQNMD